MKRLILGMSALLAAALFFACAQPASNSGSSSSSTTNGTTGTTDTSGSTSGTTTGSTTGTTTGTSGGSTGGSNAGTIDGGTSIFSGSSITPPASFTPPALPASEGTDSFAGKGYGDWYFNNDGTFTKRVTSRSNGVYYGFEELYRYSYNATDSILSTIPVTIAVWANDSQGPRVMTYEQAYNYYSTMTLATALQSVPGDTLEAKAQLAVQALPAENIASLNLPQNASPLQIVQAYLTYGVQDSLRQYSTITKYKYIETTTESTREKRFTEYYDRDFRGGKYSGSISSNGSYERLSYYETPSTHNGKTYHLQYSIDNNNSSTTNKFYEFNTLPINASGNITATNVDTPGDTLSISYTRNWAAGINTFTFSFIVNSQQKNFTLTNNTPLTVTEQIPSGSQPGSSEGGGTNGNQ